MVLRVFLTLFCLFSPFVVYGSVFINEIAWMGTENSANDEWIELYNPTDKDINLEEWGLYEQGGETLIEPLTGIIKAKSYYLIERTDDTTVPDIEASQSPTSWGGHGLNNNGEYLQLLDNNSNIVDEVDCKEGWFAGDNKTKQTMERTSSGNWQDSKNPGGTPKAMNSEQRTMNNEQKLPENGSPAAEAVSYPTGIVFSEILPSPEGPDPENEWIEIFNQNNFEVDLSDWKIEDTEGSTKIYTFPTGNKISPFGYLVLLRPETKITLNNSGEGLELICPNGKIADSINLEKATIGQSYNRTQTGWAWSTTLTPGLKNIVPLPKISEKSKEKKSEDNPLEISSFSEETASLKEEVSKPSNFLSVLLGAFAIAISSAIIILVLKKKMFQKSPPDSSYYSP